MPYLGKDYVVSDTQIANALLNIYRQTRNIIMDGCSRGNFLSFKNQTILVDADHAIDRNSPISAAFLREDFADLYPPYWAERYHAGFSRTVTHARLLHYLESHLSPEQIDNAYITPELFVQLELFYNEHRPIDVLTLNTLLKLLEECAIYGLNKPRLSPAFVLAVRDDPEHFEALFERFIVQSYAQKTTATVNLFSNIAEIDWLALCVNSPLKKNSCTV